MSELRDSIIRTAKFWTGKSDSPNGYQVTPEELVLIFEGAGCEQVPTIKEAKEAVRAIGCGVKVQNRIKHWCGIFACSVYRTCGVDVRWSLVRGRMEGPGATLVSSLVGALPGDIAIMRAGSHHYLITDIDYLDNIVHSVDGNMHEQRIRKMSRPIRYPHHKMRQSMCAYYRLQESK